MSYSLPDLMGLLVAERGEAVHLHDGEAPVLEVRQELHRIEGPPLDPGDTHTLLRTIAPPAKFDEADREGMALFVHEHSQAAHFRVVAFREGGSFRLELRRVI